MRKCRKGHEYRGDENYRARQGKCPVCLREGQRRYDQTEKGQARHAAYRNTDKRVDALARYNQSPRGWLNALHNRRARALSRRQQRKEAEDS